MLPELEIILDSLEDGRLIRTRAGSRTPLDDLLLAYTDMTLRRNDLPPIEADWQGQDLKKSISALSEADQAILVGTLRSNAKVVSAWEYQETQAQRDERQLKHWIIKASVLFVMICFLILVTVVGWAVYSNGMEGNEGVINTIINSLMEILKIVFSLN